MVGYGVNIKSSSVIMIKSHNLHSNGMDTDQSNEKSSARSFIMERVFRLPAEILYRHVSENITH